MTVQRTYYKDRYNGNKVWKVAKLKGAIIFVNMCVEIKSERGYGLQKSLIKV